MASTLPSPDARKLEKPLEPVHGEDVQPAANEEAPLMSKTRQKKLARDRRWEEGREARKVARKKKVKEKKARIRAERATASGQSLRSQPIVDSTGATGTGDPQDHAPKPTVKKATKDITRKVLLPITFIIDCSYEHLMQQKEVNSLSSQITRCYSDNHRAPFQAHLVVSSFRGGLKERYDNILMGNYRGWKGVRLVEDDFVRSASQAQEWMKEDDSRKLAGAFKPSEQDLHMDSSVELPQQNCAPQDGETVYLTSDSPNVLDRLKPYSTYIIGGLVDKNRHKGTCYKAAMNHGCKTARLPIDEYMQIEGRQVLTVNHVNEIMVKWLEYGDWGKAFLEVIPRRKGAILKDSGAEGTVLEDPAGNREAADEEARENHNASNHEVAEEEVRPISNE